MAEYFAVMDLGTNTFHLLIADGSIESFTEIVHLHEAVKLGEGGINKGIIAPAAFERGIATMNKFGEIIRENKVEKVRAIATSALRSASNGADFINKVKSEAGIAIEIIDGDKEAHYIYRGIRASGSLADNNSLIMDIGGGSVEFILGNYHNILWKQSFEIGAARLMDKFNRVDPIPAVSVTELNNYLDYALPDLFAAVKNTGIDRLIGSSGVFETFAEIIAIKNGRKFNLKKCRVYDFETDELLYVMNNLILSTHQQRATNKAIIPVRVDMIVVASLVTRYIMQKLNLMKVRMSTYSLKEGVLAELME